MLRPELPPTDRHHHAHKITQPHEPVLETAMRARARRGSDVMGQCMPADALHAAMGASGTSATSSDAGESGSRGALPAAARGTMASPKPASRRLTTAGVGSYAANHAASPRRSLDVLASPAGPASRRVRAAAAPATGEEAFIGPQEHRGPSTTKPRPFTFATDERVKHRAETAVDAVASAGMAGPTLTAPLPRAASTGIRGRTVSRTHADVAAAGGITSARAASGSRAPPPLPQPRAGSVTRGASTTARADAAVDAASVTSGGEVAAAVSHPIARAPSTVRSAAPPTIPHAPKLATAARGEHRSGSVSRTGGLLSTSAVANAAPTAAPATVSNKQHATLARTAGSVLA